MENIFVACIAISFCRNDTPRNLRCARHNEGDTRGPSNQCPELTQRKGMNSGD